MGYLEIHKDILARRIKFKKICLKDYSLIIDSYKKLRNSIYVSSGSQQSNRTDEIAQKILELTIKLEENENEIAQLERELIIVEILIIQKNKV